MLPVLKVAIVVDNPRRDLRGLALLTYQFAKRGAEVLLVPMYQQGYDLPLLAPDLVIVNYARESNRGLLQSYKSLGFRVAVLDTEGGVLSSDGLDSPENWANSLRATGLADLIDDYCLWGDTVYNAFRLYSGMDDEAMAVTGCPRYDICNEPWSQLLHHDKQHFVLVNTNFSAINPAFTRSADDEKRIFLKMGWDASYIQTLFSDLNTVFPHYLDSIEAIARGLPERLVLVRPHPFEDEKLYRERFAGLANVEIDGKGDILNSIHEADCIVHLNCGSSVDAVRMGKTPISMEYLNTDVLRRHAPLPSRVSCPAKSIEDLVNLVDDRAKRETAFDIHEAQRIIEPWYHLSDGKAAQRVTEFLLTRIRMRNISQRARSSIGVALRGGRPKASRSQYLQGALGLLTGSRVASAVAVSIQKKRGGKAIELSIVAELLQRFTELDDGPAIEVRRARSPIGGQPLSSLRIEKL